MDVGNAPAACSWASLPEFLRRVAAGKLNLVRSYPVQEERERHEPGDGLVPEVRPPGDYAGAGVKTPKWLPAGSCKSAKTSPSLLVAGGTSTFPPSRSTWAQTAATSWTTTMKIAWFGNSPPVSS